MIAWLVGSRIGQGLLIGLAVVAGLLGLKVKWQADQRARDRAAADKAASDARGRMDRAAADAPRTDAALVDLLKKGDL